MIRLTAKLDTHGWDAYGDLMPRAIRETRAEALQDAAQIMIATVPVSDNDDPGHVHTRDTIGVNEAGDAVEAGGAILFLEFGTVNMAAQPTMIPAFHKVVNDLDKRLAAKVRDVGLG